MGIAYFTGIKEHLINIMYTTNVCEAMYEVRPSQNLRSAWKMCYNNLFVYYIFVIFGSIICKMVYNNNFLRDIIALYIPILPYKLNRHYAKLSNH